jgi:NitT/TauT family transport system substrate-binding protein
MRRRELLNGMTSVGMMAALGCRRASARALTNIRFSTDFFFQGNHAIWGLGLKQGLFEAQGLNVSMDRGYGSGDTVVRVASGAYDFGFADINALVKFNADNPNRRVISVLQGFDRTLNSITALKRSGIAKPSDLNGRTMGAPDGDASRLMFPAFARLNGIDVAKVTWKSVSSDIREAVLAQNQVEAISGSKSTTLFNLLRIGLKPEDIVSFPYSSYGLDLYGAGVIVREEYMNSNPELVRSFVKGTIDSTLALLKDKAAGIAAMHERDALFDQKLEMERLQLVLDDAMLTPDVRKNGIGTIDPKRIALTIAVNAEAYGIAHPPAPEQLYTEMFLPPRADRLVPT